MLSIQLFFKHTGQTILALIKILILSRFKSEIRKENQSKSALILLNGPSLKSLAENKTDALTENDTVCVNFFPLTALYEKVRPDYFIISAPELWLEDVDDIYRKKSREVFKTLAEKTIWDLTVMIPFASKKTRWWQETISENSHIKVIFYNDTGVEGFRRFIFWLYKKGIAIPRPHNVLVPSLMNMINLGYKTIYLWGAENNQFLDLSVDDNNMALINQKHFYDKDQAKPKAMKKLGKGRRKVHEILHKFMLSFEAYHVIEDYAKNRGTLIINQTPGSLIDAFQREKIS